MGGKGRRRREKNFKAAHGLLHTRLPPAPKPNDLEALPFKLRKLIELKNSATIKGSFKNSDIIDQRTKKENLGDKQNVNKKRPCDSATIEPKEKGNSKDASPPSSLHDKGETRQDNEMDSKNSKRKKKRVVDHRFDATAKDLLMIGSKRRERRKKYLEEKNKKLIKTKISEVVEAPPKLNFPKKLLVTKTPQDVSRERIRLQTVESYRNRKGWSSRPGTHIPPMPTMISPS
ncbi:transcription initiation factor TFIID subunit 3 isoform X2 [Amborella trichopoda]|uniref:transcription initiation factor TFIID subunit 3 isoform X2 n=1 Tax=Amborella trichopoda TaxID=13333 RepID=UPI0009C1685E|nr:transcription initiation factor TFIID subunit 3 isoform X2 [Amborella trichopoda]|eukprot:XP_020531355.1 transcription initiation factor TFIID subunit 3 isoform X2 [Amborella trichopoda]